MASSNAATRSADSPPSLRASSTSSAVKMRAGDVDGEGQAERFEVGFGARHEGQARVQNHSGDPIRAGFEAREHGVRVPELRGLGPVAVAHGIFSPPASSLGGRSQELRIGERSAFGFDDERNAAGFGRPRRVPVRGPGYSRVTRPRKWHGGLRSERKMLARDRRSWYSKGRRTGSTTGG